MYNTYTFIKADVLGGHHLGIMGTSVRFTPALCGLFSVGLVDWCNVFLWDWLSETYM